MLFSKLKDALVMYETDCFISGDRKYGLEKYINDNKNIVRILALV